MRNIYSALIVLLSQGRKSFQRPSVFQTSISCFMLEASGHCCGRGTTVRRNGIIWLASLLWPARKIPTPLALLDVYHAPSTYLHLESEPHKVFFLHYGIDINKTKFSVMSGKRIFGTNFGFRV